MKEKSCLTAIIGLPLVMLFIVGLSLWSGYALHKLWTWHIAGFGGLPESKYSTMVAIDLFVSLILGTRGTNFNGPKDKDKTDFELAFSGVVAGTLIPALGLLVGWLLAI